MEMGEDATNRQTQESIEKYGQVSMDNSRQQHRIHLLSIIGEVEGHECLPGTSKTTKYEHVLPTLAEIEDSKDVDGLPIEKPIGLCRHQCFLYGIGSKHFKTSVFSFQGMDDIHIRCFFYGRHIFHDCVIERFHTIRPPFSGMHGAD